jgi:hypothetical protein
VPQALGFVSWWRRGTFVLERTPLTGKLLSLVGIGIVCTTVSATFFGVVFLCSFKLDGTVGCGQDHSVLPSFGAFFPP